MVRFRSRVRPLRLQRFISLKGFEALKKAKEVLEGKKSVESGREKLEREREREIVVFGVDEAATT
jgi:hypothetical protein